MRLPLAKEISEIALSKTPCTDGNCDHCVIGREVYRSEAMRKWSRTRLLYCIQNEQDTDPADMLLDALAEGIAIGIEYAIQHNSNPQSQISS